MDKTTKKQITEVLKQYKDMQFLLDQLNRNLQYCTDERREVRILNTIEAIKRDKIIIDKALQSLTDKHRNAFELRFVKELNADDTAEVMGVNRSTVYTYTNTIIEAVYDEIFSSHIEKVGDVYE